MKKSNNLLAIVVAIVFFPIEELTSQIIVDDIVNNSIKSIVCPNRLTSYWLTREHTYTQSYTWTVTNGEIFGDATLHGSLPVNVRWNSTTTTANTGKICVNGPGINNICSTVTIRSVKGYQIPQIYINNNEWSSASYAIQGNSFTIGVVNNNNTNFYYPNAPQQNETILSSFQWSLPPNMTSGGKSGAFTGNKIITVDATNFTGTGIIKVRLINQECSDLPASDYYGVYKEITVSKVSATISGPSTVCTSNATYTLSAGAATSWTVQPASAFSIVSQNSTSVVVKALNYSGTLGTLTATVDGVATVIKTIATCDISISGPSVVCMEPVVYSLPTGITATSWYVTPVNDVVTIVSTSATSATLTAKYPIGRHISLRAVVNGITVAKDLRLCADSIIGPTAIGNNTFIYTLSNPEAFAACTTCRWWFEGIHYLQIGLQPDTATSVFTPATVTLRPGAGSDAQGLRLYFGCTTTDLNADNAISTQIIIPPATSDQPVATDTLQMLRKKEDDNNLPE